MNMTTQEQLFHYYTHAIRMGNLNAAAEIASMGVRFEQRNIATTKYASLYNEVKDRLVELGKLGEWARVCEATLSFQKLLTPYDVSHMSHVLVEQEIGFLTKLLVSLT